MLFTQIDQGVERGLAFVYRPDWVEHAGNLTLCVLAHGGAQDVTTWLDTAVHASEMLSAEQPYIDETGTEVLPAPDAVDHMSRVVFVAPAGIMWNRVAQGGWASEIGQDGLLLAPPDVDFFARLPDLVEALFQNLFQRLFGHPAGGRIFPRAVYLGFSNGACLGFRIASERPGVYQGFALAGSNCAGFDHVWRQAEGGPPYQYASPFATDAADASQVLHLSIGRGDEEVHFVGADAATPPAKVGGIDEYIDADAPPPVWDESAEWSVSAWHPLQYGWESLTGVGQWVTSVDARAPLTVADAGSISDFSNAAGARLRIVVVDGLGHALPSRTLGLYDWAPAALHYLLVGP